MPFFVSKFPYPLKTSLYQYSISYSGLFSYQYPCLSGTPSCSEYWGQSSCGNGDIYNPKGADSFGLFALYGSENHNDL